MLTFLLQGFDTLVAGHVHLFFLLFAVVVGMWIARLYLSRSYAPATEAYEISTAVIIPVVDEPVDLFTDVLTRITAQSPDEIVVVINGARNETLEDVCDAHDVFWVWTEKAGKRHAVEVGMNHVTSDVIVLVDSDTLWTEDTLSELVKPFADETVGGVTTRQQILEPNRTPLTRWADWLETTRIKYSMPAMSALGTVGCLPGRTIALRREVIADNMEKFLNEKFLGVFLEISDDRTLTNYALLDGWKTVYQETSLVYTDAPTQLGKLAKQQYRWARGSQYNTMRMLTWMVRKTPWLAFFYIMDILVPFLVTGVIAAWAIRVFGSHDGVNVYLPVINALGGDIWSILLTILLAIAASWAFAAVRFARVLKVKPADVWWIPFYQVMNSLFLVPIRLYGFMRSATKAGWGTRAGAYTGDDNAVSALRFVPTVIGIVLLVGITGLGLLLQGA